MSEKKYVIDNKGLMEEWDFSKNTDINPETITLGSHKKAWWICKKHHHSWEAEIKSRYYGNGCPYCSGLKALAGFNDLQTINPSLSKEWNYIKNKNLMPTMFTSNSGEKVWWVCKNKHEWLASIKDRNHGRGCPYCANKKIIQGFNDLQTFYPKIAEEWNYDKNGSLLPSMVAINSNKKIWWKCKRGHEWQAIIYSRVNGNNCPYCSGQKVLAGFNDLQTKNPNLAKEWNYEKNEDLTPAMFTVSSGKKVWWKCRKGHEWESVILNRTIGGNSCPICNMESQTSFPEQAILYYCKKVTTAENRFTAFGREIDIYLPKLNVGIEYNGIYYHKHKKVSDKNKIDFFKNKGIKIITIAESDCNLVEGNKINYIYSHKKESLNWAINELFKLINLENIKIDVINDSAEILSQYIINEKQNSLVSQNPDIAMEWNYEKNLSLMPDMVLSRSGKKVWWKCNLGHEWQAAVYARVQGNKCPFCSNKKLLTGYNDLSTLYPILAEEWNYEKNKDILPSMVRITDEKVWWKCKKGHEWKTSIRRRAIDNQSCPICTNHKILTGFNDLKTLNPALAKEWDYSKNDLSPETISPNNHQKVWWICSKGHSWEAQIKSRNNGSGCPYCSGRNAISGVNDLKTLNLILAQEWNYEKNNDLTPDMILPNSNKKVWWKCSKCNHEWQATIASRNNGRGCPYCLGRKKDN